MPRFLIVLSVAGMIAALSNGVQGDSLETIADCGGKSRLAWAFNCVNNFLGDPAGRVENAGQTIKNRVQRGIDRARDAARDAYYDAFGRAGRNAREVDNVLTRGRSGNIVERGMDLVEQGASGNISPENYNRRVDNFGRDIVYDSGRALENMHPRTFGLARRARETVETVKGHYDDAVKVIDDTKQTARNAYDWLKERTYGGTDSTSTGVEQQIRTSYEESSRDYAAYSSGVDPETFVGEDRDYLAREVFGDEATHRAYEYEVIEEAYTEAGFERDDIYFADGREADPYYEDKAIYAEEPPAGENVSWIETEKNVFRCESEYCEKSDTPWIELEPEYAYDCGDDGRCSAEYVGNVDYPESDGARNDELGKELAGLLDETLKNSASDYRELGSRLDSHYDVEGRLNRAEQSYESEKQRSLAAANEAFNRFMQGFAMGMQAAAQAMQQNGQFSAPALGSNAYGSGFSGGQGLGGGGGCQPLPPACQRAQDQAMTQVNRIKSRPLSGMCSSARVAIQVYQVGLQANRVCANSYPAGNVCRQSLEAQIREYERALSQSRQSARGSCGR